MAQPAPDALPGHVFRAADGEAKCPTCGFPAWSHDPATAVMRTWTIQPAPDPLREAAEVVVGRFLDTPASLAGVHVAALNALRAALGDEP